MKKHRGAIQFNKLLRQTALDAGAFAAGHNQCVLSRVQI